MVLLLVALAVTPFWRGGRDGLGYLVATAALFVAWFFWTARPRKQIPLPSVVQTTLALLVVFLLASSVWADNQYVALLRVLAVLCSVLLFMLVRQVVQLPTGKEKLLMLLTAMSVPVMVFGVYLYYSTIYDRAASFFYAPNSYALYLLIIWLVSLRFWSKEFSWKWLVLSASVLSQFLLVQSLATTAIAVLTTALTLWLLKIRKQQLLVLGAVAILAFAISLAMVRLKELSDVQNIGTPDIASELITAKTSGVTERFEYWQATGEIFTDNLAFGVGLDNFQSVYPQYQENPGLVVGNPHNFYLQTYAEGGIIGGSLLVAALISLMIIWWRSRYNREANLFAIMILAVGLHIGFYPSFRYPTVVYLTVLLLAIWLSLVASNLPKKIPVKLNILFPLLAFVLVIPSAIHFRSDSFADRGMDLYRERNIADTIKYLQAATDLPIARPEAFRTLAIASSFSSEFDIALPAVDKAIAGDSQDGQNYGAKAFALERSGAPSDQVRENYETALRLDPFNSVDVYRNYVSYLLRSGDTNRAKEIVDFILPFYDDATLQKREALNDLRKRVGLLNFQSARVHAVLGDTERTIKDLERTLELHPTYALAQSLLEDLRRTN